MDGFLAGKYTAEEKILFEQQPYADFHQLRFTAPLSSLVVLAFSSPVNRAVPSESHRQHFCTPLTTERVPGSTEMQAHEVLVQQQARHLTFYGSVQTQGQ